MSFKFPYPVSPTRIPSSYQQLANEGGQGAILELPAGEQYFEHMSWYMYFQTSHQQPLVSGYLGRRPERLQKPEHEMEYVKRFFKGGSGPRRSSQ